MLQPRRPVLVLVGPGRHFGRELIHRFRVEGFNVGVIASTSESLEELVDKIGPDEGVRFARGDVKNSAEFGIALGTLTTEFGGLDCLIYNPKVSVYGSGLTTSPDELAGSLQVNVVGAVVAIQAALPHFSTAVNPTIILTGGGYKDVSDVDKFALSVGKSALHAVARALQRPLRQRGIKLKTVVIRKVVRSGDLRWGSAHELAEYFWHVYAHGKSSVFYYPPRGQNLANQLSFWGAASGSSR